MNSLIKWPGGKAREVKYIENMIPQFDRYIEPFFGGGAMYFYLQPQKALINDISTYLMDFYRLVKEQDSSFQDYLKSYHYLITDLLSMCDRHYNEILQLYHSFKNGEATENSLEQDIRVFIKENEKEISSDASKKLVLNNTIFEKHLLTMATDKMLRTIKNEQKKPFSDVDLKENLITGFISGLYMYFREVYNDILLKRNRNTNKAYKIANFYFIREYCYGSMFRYNRKGEFNIPYGGMSYNRKNFMAKIDNIFSKSIQAQFENTDVYCEDFSDFINKANLCENDFMFLDPPYDTDFSDYEGKDFTHNDQRRLAETLTNTKAKFILIIKNTDFIYSLYKDNYNILCFDKTYTYNVRSRNERNVEHLIVTNLPI